jgi:hypothetical protein
MMRFLLIIAIFVACMGVRGYAQTNPLPEGFTFNMHSDMDQYTRYIIPCVNWLQQTPLNEQKAERSKMNFFVLHWLERNPDIDISMPEYSLKFNGIHREFLCLFLEGWIKYVLETKDTVVTNCSMAGLNSMLDYYRSGKASSLGRIDFLENLSKIERAGKLRNLFDTSHTAHNTFLYLKVPYKKHTFKHDENYFGFHYYTINLINPRDITYRYMLDGYYNDWIVTTDGSVTYPRLPPGDYNFRVQASMFPNFENAVESSYPFTINKPFWQEIWFLSLAAITLFSLVYYVINQREKTLKNIAHLDRMRITFEYEYLKSQVNPHFLFNSLNTLTNLIAKDQKKALAYTENLSGLYHSIVAHHDNDLALLSEEFKILNDYLSIQKGRFGDALQMQINIPPDIMDSKKIVPLALQMLIENAIKHNIVSTVSPLVINIFTDGNELIISNFVKPKLSKAKGQGIGLINIKRRYGLLTKRTVSYGLYENQFIVKLPLL